MCLNTLKFKDLAVTYFPDILPKSASRKLSDMIKMNRKLRARLKKLEWKSGSHYLTPRQRDAIYYYLGEP